MCLLRENMNVNWGSVTGQCVPGEPEYDPVIRLHQATPGEPTVRVLTREMGWGILNKIGIGGILHKIIKLQSNNLNCELKYDPLICPYQVTLWEHKVKLLT